MKASSMFLENGQSVQIADCRLQSDDKKDKF
ncbi:hypothetical protein VCR4J2_250742 [Vibrio coralliirubri]|nr:hypothetical protein VCR4J2_250742 [Vibrio coralliirubri]